MSTFRNIDTAQGVSVAATRLDRVVVNATAGCGLTIRSGGPRGPVILTIPERVPAASEYLVGVDVPGAFYVHGTGWPSAEDHHRGLPEGRPDRVDVTAYYETTDDEQEQEHDDV